MLPRLLSEFLTKSSRLCSNRKSTAGYRPFFYALFEEIEMKVLKKKIDSAIRMLLSLKIDRNKAKNISIF